MALQHVEQPIALRKRQVVSSRWVHRATERRRRQRLRYRRELRSRGRDSAPGERRKAQLGLVVGDWRLAGRINASIIALLPLVRAGLWRLAGHPRMEFVARLAPRLELAHHLGIGLYGYELRGDFVEIAALDRKDETDRLSRIEMHRPVASGEFPIHREGIGCPVGFDDAGERV